MSTGYIFMWIFIALYIGMGTGTYMKHYEQLGNKYALFCIFSLPVKALVKSFALLPMICSAVYGAYIAKKNNLDTTINGEDETAFTISLDYFK